MLFEVVTVIIKIIFVYAFVLNLVGLLTWVERKQSAVMQDRIGANRAAIFGIALLGLFHTISDGLKMMFKEDFIPAKGNKLFHRLAPIISMFSGLLVFAVIPFGDHLILKNHLINLQIADLNIGFLFAFAVLSLSSYGPVLAGFSSYNKYTLLGALRAVAQTISYELVLGLTVIGVVMVYESFNLQDIIYAQGDTIFGFIPKWGIVVQPFAFFLFLAAIIAETERIPFDLPEGESEIIGFNLEYSGMKYATFMMSDFVKIVVAACLITIFFFGGWQVPFLNESGFVLPGGTTILIPHLLIVLLQVLSFIVKICFFSFFQILVRWTLPRFRYDQLMKLSWKVLLPASLVNLIITAFLIILLQGKIS